MADTTYRHSHIHPDTPKSPHNQFTDIRTSISHTCILTCILTQRHMATGRA